jgi:hypothetical protein
MPTRWESVAAVFPRTERPRRRPVTPIRSADRLAATGMLWPHAMWLSKEARVSDKVRFPSRTFRNEATHVDTAIRARPPEIGTEESG